MAFVRGQYRPRRRAPEPEPEKQEDPRAAAIAEAQRALNAAKRALKVKRARGDGWEALKAFIELMWPDPEFPDDPDKSLFDCEAHHRILLEMVANIEARKMLRAACSMPPQHGKSLILSRFGLAWILGKHPEWRVLFATYNDDLATTRGDELRSVLESRAFREVFPKATLKRGSRAKDEMVFEAGGSINLVGRGSGTTGRPADLFIIDDPYKDDEEAKSDGIREKVRDWYSGVAQTRCPVWAPILIVHCMTGDTPVLMASGAEKALRDVRPGDVVATYRDGVLGASRVAKWANQGPDSVYAIRMTSGITVKANARHPFLAWVDGEPKWLKTADLRPGHAIFRAIGVSGAARHARGTGATTRLFAAGTALRTTTRSGGQTAYDRPPPTASLDAPRTSNTGTELPTRIIGASTSSRAGFALSAKNLRAIAYALIGEVSCASITATARALFARFSATTAIWRSATLKPSILRSLSPTTSDFTLDRIAEISAAGVEDVFDIEVAETENFIAGGLVSHNTRWNEDDLIGWLCDPEHPVNRANPERAKRWKYVNLPSPVDDEDLAAALDLPLGSALWPKRFPLHHLEEIKANDGRLYAALYLGQPAPEDGDLFKAEHWSTYQPNELPRSLRVYAASDHALGEKQRNDPTCMGMVGVCDRNIVWVLPDLFWDRKPPDEVVERMLKMAKRNPPLWWRAGRDHISKSIGPFLRKRMQETNTFINMIEEPETGDKVRKAQAILARYSSGGVRFPAGAPWLAKARAELLKFPNAKHDDLVDFLSLIGRGLRTMHGAAKPKQPEDDGRPKVGTIAWIKWAAKQDAAAGKARGRLATM